MDGVEKKKRKSDCSVVYDSIIWPGAHVIDNDLNDCVFGADL